MNRTLRLILLFYQNYVVVGILLTLVCWYKLYVEGVLFLSTAIIIKTIVNIVIVLYLNQSKKQSFYFYYNFGLGKLVLWSGSLLTDFFIFSVGAALILAYVGG